MAESSRRSCLDGDFSSGGFSSAALEHRIVSAVTRDRAVIAQGPCPLAELLAVPLQEKIGPRERAAFLRQLGPDRLLRRSVPRRIVPLLLAEPQTDRDMHAVGRDGRDRPPAREEQDLLGT